MQTTTTIENISQACFELTLKSAAVKHKREILIMDFVKLTLATFVLALNAGTIEVRWVTVQRNLRNMYFVHCVDIIFYQAHSTRRRQQFLFSFSLQLIIVFVTDRAQQHECCYVTRSISQAEGYRCGWPVVLVHRFTSLLYKIAIKASFIIHVHVRHTLSYLIHIRRRNHVPVCVDWYKTVIKLLTSSLFFLHHDECILA